MKDIMGERTVEWLIYTCLVGLIPAIARLLVWGISNEGVEPLALSDLVAFGLVLHSANINEVGRISGADVRWKIVHNGLSIIFLVMYAILLFTTILASDKLDKDSALHVTAVMSVISLFLSWSVFRRAQVAQGVRP